MHISFSNSFSNNIVSLFSENSEGYWIGTEAGGLNFFDRNSALFSSFRVSDGKGLKSDYIKCLEMDLEGNLWIGTWGKGIFRMDANTGKFTNFLEPQNVFCLSGDTIGKLWVGTLNGLYRLDMKTGSQNFYSPETGSGLRDYFITSLFFDKRQNIWVGTKTGGLYLYNPVKDNFIAYTHHENDSSSLNDNYIISINNDTDGNL